MQRQSLGGASPSSKLVKDEHPRSQPFPTSSSSSSSPLSSPTTAAAAATAPINTTGASFYGRMECKAEEDGPKKLTRGKLSKSTPPESYIHLIPMLTLFCFFILYLSSHDPSALDLAEFNAFKHFSNLQGIVEIKKGDVLAVRGLKNLEQAAAKLRRRHRKMASV